MTWRWIQLAAAAACLLVGIIFMVLAVFGVNRFHKALNRMHAAAMGDTLGILFVFAGLIVMRGFSMDSLKLFLVILFFWSAGPVSGHMISRLEAMTDEELGKILIIRKTGKEEGTDEAVGFARDLLTSIVIFMSYSLIMCVIWILLQSPDLAITEAAVGAGVTSILFFITLKKIRAISKVHDEADGRTVCGEGRDEQEKG